VEARCIRALAGRVSVEEKKEDKVALDERGLGGDLRGKTQMQATGMLSLERKHGDRKRS